MATIKPTREQLSAYFFNDCDEDTTVLVEKWFYNFGKTDEAVELLHELWMKIESESSSDNSSDVETAFETFKSRLLSFKEEKSDYSIRKRMSPWLRRAAVLLFLPLLSLTMYLCFHSDGDSQIRWMEKSVAFGEIEKLALPDGSVVWLNSGSTIIYPSEFKSDMRQIFFDGEGYFDVYTDADRPMNIHVKGNLVQVHGTTFNLKAYKNENILELSLMDGSVSFSTAGSDDQKHYLSPGESLTYDMEQDKFTHSCFSKDNVTVWKEGGLYFRNKTLDEIVRQLERTYDIRIVILNEELRQIRYHMAFVNNESIEDILQFIDNDSRVIVSRRGDVVEIY